MRKRRLRGLVELVSDVVEHGSRAVEGVHKATASRPFDVLAKIPPLAAPSELVRLVHDASVSGVYGSIRLVNKAVAVAAGVAFDLAESQSGKDPGNAPVRERPSGDSATARERPGGR